MLTGWDAEQMRVITADSDARLIVEAGPGTGKTAVACARLAHLISEEDIEPSKILMISFTRAAAAEIRARLHPRWVARRVVVAPEIGRSS